MIKSGINWVKELLCDLRSEKGSQPLDDITAGMGRSWLWESLDEN
jgi:hypothetical protein